LCDLPPARSCFRPPQQQRLPELRPRFSLLRLGPLDFARFEHRSRSRSPTSDPSRSGHRRT
jgi:hypothetical protein